MVTFTVKSCDVKLPHINYTIRVRPFKKPPRKIADAKAWISRDSKCQCTIYTPLRSTPGGLAHEVIHALQYICQDRHMDFLDEFEHMAYIMQYAMGRACGHVWAQNK